jgi:hypothetical protein
MNSWRAGQKNPIKIDAPNHHTKKRKGRPKKGQKRHSPPEPKKGES